MQYTNLIWRNDQPYSEMFDDIYYSSNEGEGISGESEFNHVFFKNNGLPERWSDNKNFVIAELGFGSGLNCILTIREWLKQPATGGQKKCLHYIAIEKYPLSPVAISELVSYPELKYICDELIENYPPAVQGTHSRHLFESRVVIHYKFMDVYDALDNECFNVDAWYLDGFSPAKNADMWSQGLFEKIAQNSHIGTRCATYTSAGFVKRNLQAAGFTVSKVSGYGKKREMLVAGLTDKEPASLKYKDKPWFSLAFSNDAAENAGEKNATIIGAGIAGLSAAYALVNRGWSVTIVDKQGDIAKEMSSNPAPIVYPRLSVNDDVDMEFFTAAYCYVLHIYKRLQKKSQQRFWFDDGLLQLMDKNRITQIIRKFNFNSDYISILDGVNGDLAGATATIEYPSAGVVLPAILCEVLKQSCEKKLNIIDAEVTAIHYDGKKWQCLHDSQLIDESATLIIANGAGINDLALQTTFPVEDIRGQVVMLNAGAESCFINKTINADVHITPAINGRHYLGATYSKASKDPAIEQKDTAELLKSLDVLYPNMFKAEDYCAAWVGFRTMSQDRVPIVGAIPDEAFFNAEYADICHGRVNKDYLPAAYLKGLYISAAHGSRGFTSSFLCAEIIASQITGEPSPVSRKVMDHLSPSRFIVNDLKRR